MTELEFFRRYYAATIGVIDRAITFIEKGYVKEAQTLLELALCAAEEEYINDGQEFDRPYAEIIDYEKILRSRQAKEDVKSAQKGKTLPLGRGGSRRG